MSDLTPAEESALLAAEYVLGVLDASERRLAAARAANDVAFAAEIADWETMLGPLAALVDQVEPPPELWDRIRRAIVATPALSLVPQASVAALRAWRRATFAALAVAAGFAVVAILPRAPATVTIAAISPLSATGGAFAVRVQPSGKLTIVALSRPVVAQGRDLELWALPPGATRPSSLGVMPAGGVVLTAAAGLIQPGGKLLISVEPKGGSPTGLPTGPVLWGGTITQL